jgi:hypothetical protein
MNNERPARRVLADLPLSLRLMLMRKETIATLSERSPQAKQRAWFLIKRRSMLRGQSRRES